jgi:ubiquinone/menaquinone biosynthesis C-methylase UbiE
LAANHQTHKPFSDKLAFVLNNPIRRTLYPPERLIATLDLGPNDVVVDFGCGPGFYLIPLAKVAGKAIGIDVSTRMLERAAYHAKKAKVEVELLQNDGTNIRLPNDSVNLIVLVHVFHEVNDKRTVLNEFRRILKPGGRLAIVEKTRADRISPVAFGPPTVDEKKAVHEIQQAGFGLMQAIPRGKDSIIMCVK